MTCTRFRFSLGNAIFIRILGENDNIRTYTAHFLYVFVQYVLKSAQMIQNIIADQEAELERKLKTSAPMGCGHTKKAVLFQDGFFYIFTDLF